MDNLEISRAGPPPLVGGNVPVPITVGVITLPLVVQPALSSAPANYLLW